MGGVVVQDLQAWILADVLPAEAQALLAGGMQQGHVMALYPMPAPVVARRLLTRLTACVPITSAAEVSALMGYATERAAAHGLSAVLPLPPLKSMHDPAFELARSILDKWLLSGGQVLPGRSTNIFYMRVGTAAMTLGDWVAGAAVDGAMTAALAFWFDVCNFNPEAAVRAAARAQR